MIRAPLRHVLRARPWLLDVIAFALPVFTAQAFWMALPERFRVNESADYRTFYEPVARSLVAGHGLQLPDGRVALDYPPGHSLAIAASLKSAALFGIPDAAAVRILGLLCLGLSSLALWRMARRLWGDRVALVASIGWSVYPLTLWLSKQPNSELPFTALLFIAVALFFNALHKSDEAWLRWLAAGALVGAAMLVRPIAILLPFVLCALILWRARSLSRSFRVAACGFLLAGTALLVVPWELWAYRRSGTFVLLSTGGVASMKDGFTFAVDHRDYRQGVAVPADVADFMRPIFSERMTSVGDVVKAVARESRARPTAAIKLFLIKLARAWYGTDSQRMESPILLIQMVVLAILLAATVIAWREAAALRDAAICVWGILLYFWFMNLASLPLARYTAPAIGLLFVLLPGLAARALRSAPELTRAPG